MVVKNKEKELLFFPLDDVMEIFPLLALDQEDIVNSTQQVLSYSKYSSPNVLVLMLL